MSLHNMALYIIYKDSVRISQTKQRISIREVNGRMLYRGKMAVYCGNHTEHTADICVNQTHTV
jgi:hypothetical protein